MNSSAYIHDIARVEVREIHTTGSGTGNFSRTVVITGKDGATVELTLFAADAASLVLRDQGDHAKIVHDLDRSDTRPIEVTKLAATPLQEVPRAQV